MIGPAGFAGKKKKKKKVTSHQEAPVLGRLDRPPWSVSRVPPRQGRSQAPGCGRLLLSPAVAGRTCGRPRRTAQRTWRRC